MRRNQVSTNSLITFSVAFYLLVLTGCSECDPSVSKSRELTESEKHFFPVAQGEVLRYQDETGKVYSFTCTYKKYARFDSEYDVRANDCASAIFVYHRLDANFSTDLITIGGNPLIIKLSLDSPYGNFYSSGYYSCNYFLQSSPFTFMFLNGNLGDTNYGLDTFMGFANPDSDQLLNFMYRPEIKLNHKLYKGVNIQSIDTSSYNSCRHPSKFVMDKKDASSTKVGMDSIYYSKTNGLIRFTTIAGKKYHRIL